MSKAILIMGESGSGKTTSLRNLPPAESYYFDADGKGLSWRGWRDGFNRENKNYKVTSDYEIIMGTLESCKKSAGIKNIVIDTINAVMLDKEMKDAAEHGFKKWSDLAGETYNLIQMANRMRDDQTVIILGHSETITQDDGYMFTRLKTNGRKLEKIVLESKFNIVLHAVQKEQTYVLKTRGMNTTAKTPMGMFDTNEIENDIMIVLKAMETSY